MTAAPPSEGVVGNPRPSGGRVEPLDGTPAGRRERLPDQGPDGGASSWVAIDVPPKAMR
jgi:hypothetical protein